MTTDPAAKFEELSFDFIAEEIELGFTFATVAATEYALGNVDHAREVWGKADTACTEAERRLSEAQHRGYDIADLRERLRELRARLAEVKDNEREARNAA